jgi:hypothetical protein
MSEDETADILESARQTEASIPTNRSNSVTAAMPAPAAAPMNGRQISEDEIHGRALTLLNANPKSVIGRRGRLHGRARRFA